MEADASLFAPPVNTHVHKKGWVGMLCGGGQRTKSVQRGRHALSLWHTAYLLRPQEHWRR